MDELFPDSPNKQATNQILAIIVTLAFALVGGLITGFVMHIVGKFGKLEEEDFYDDNVNIDEVDEKCAPPEEVLCLLERQGDKETSALLTNGH